jgi:hypothetical protein
MVFQYIHTQRYSSRDSLLPPQERSSAGLGFQCIPKREEEKRLRVWVGPGPITAIPELVVFLEFKLVVAVVPAIVPAPLPV